MHQYCPFFYIDEKNINAWVVSVVRSHGWTPEQIGRLYLDAIDYHGLEFWYEDVKKVDKETKEKAKRK